ncbi:Pinin [Chionoecetes opilio]|uniref:Pinin n=1 Tax=Chionoecetes opilio TaxID=41210 RepID=A0A8J4Y8B8_CHIOP|nr:Pinin [Chionoecetes opilio]
MASAVSGISLVNTIQSEIERARQDLKGFDENLRRLTGRDFNDPNQRQDLRRVRLASGNRDNEEPPAKRRPPGGVFARLGAVVLDQQHPEPRGRGRADLRNELRNEVRGDHRNDLRGDNRNELRNDLRGDNRNELRNDLRGENRNELRNELRVDHRGVGRGKPHPELRPEEPRGRRVQEVMNPEEKLPKPSLASSVARPAPDSKSRTEAAAELTKDRASRDRNRRMFGALLGTLKRFKNDEAKQKDKEEQRQAIERKLEEKGRVEKEELRRERLQLFNQRKERQAQIRRLTIKMARVKEHETWEAHQMKLAKFIRTESSPAIFWVPRLHNARTTGLVMATHDKITGELEQEQRRMKQELDAILGSRGEDREAAEMGEEEETFVHRGVRSQVAKQGEGGGNDPLDICPDLLDYEAEEGELVYDEADLSGKEDNDDTERMVVQVDGRGEGGRKVEIVASQPGGENGEVGKSGGGLGNDSEKENEGRHIELPPPVASVEPAESPANISYEVSYTPPHDSHSMSPLPMNPSPPANFKKTMSEADKDAAGSVEGKFVQNAKDPARADQGMGGHDNPESLTEKQMNLSGTAVPEKQASGIKDVSSKVPTKAKLQKDEKKKIKRSKLKKKMDKKDASGKKKKSGSSDDSSSGSSESSSDSSESDSSDSSSSSSSSDSSSDSESDSSVTSSSGSDSDREKRKRKRGKRSRKDDRSSDSEAGKTKKKTKKVEKTKQLKEGGKISKSKGREEPRGDDDKAKKEAGKDKSREGRKGKEKEENRKAKEMDKGRERDQEHRKERESVKKGDNRDKRDKNKDQRKERSRSREDRRGGRNDRR